MLAVVTLLLVTAPKKRVHRQRLDIHRDVNAAINLMKMAVAQTVTACRQGGSGLGLTTEAKLPLGQELSNYCGVN